MTLRLIYAFGAARGKHHLGSVYSDLSHRRRDRAFDSLHRTKDGASRLGCLFYRRSGLCCGRVAGLRLELPSGGFDVGVGDHGLATQIEYSSLVAGRRAQGAIVTCGTAGAGGRGGGGGRKGKGRGGGKGGGRGGEEGKGGGGKRGGRGGEDRGGEGGGPPRREGEGEGGGRGKKGEGRGGGGGGGGGRGGGEGFGGGGSGEGGGGGGGGGCAGGAGGGGGLGGTLRAEVLAERGGGPNLVLDSTGLSSSRAGQDRL